MAGSMAKVGRHPGAWGDPCNWEPPYHQTKGSKEQAGFAKEYCAKVEKELNEICSGILKLLIYDLIPKASMGESKVFYFKMKGDYYRYFAEFAAEDARVAYEEATTNAAKDLAVTYPIRFGLVLNYSVFQYEVLSNPVEAVKDACKLLIAAALGLPRRSSGVPDPGELIYSSLFDAAPSMHSLFVTPRAVQAMKFVSNLDEIVRAIDALEKLKITVETLAFGHL
jgi:hypothetical protein